MEKDIDGIDVQLETTESRNKTSLRLKYEAETRVFRTRFGGLEDIRQRLGLSRRQICQILLVDPSAWTRWCKDEDRVPPHIYRALEWYLTLEAKTELHPKLSRVYLGSLDEKSSKLEEEVELLKKQIQKNQRFILLLSSILTLAVVAIFALFFEI